MFVCIFSYNRLEALLNCIASVKLYIPNCNINIFDDNSDDPRILEALNELSRLEDVNVFVNQNIVQNDKKVGGLTSLMNVALQECVENKVETALFIQDDMQVTRLVDETEQKKLNDLFLHNPMVYEIYTCFLTSLNVRNIGKAKSLRVDELFEKCQVDDGMVLNNFCDIGIFHIQRTVDNLEFFSGERNDDEKTRTGRYEMLCYRHPFMHWLPFPISYRGKTRSFLYRLIEVSGGCGIHRVYAKKNVFEYREEFAKFAEDYLDAPSAPQVKSWSTIGGHTNIIQRLPILRKLLRYISRVK